MKQLVSSWQTFFSVLFISFALFLCLCAKYFCKYFRRQRNAGTEEVILPLQYSSETTTSSVLHNNILPPSLIPTTTTTTTSEDEHGEQRQEEEEEVLLAENNVCFQDLPADVLLHIMSFLPLASIGPLVRVCKSWGDVLRDPQNMDLFLGRKPLGRPNHNPIYLFERHDYERQRTDLYLLDSMRTSTYHVSKLNVEKEMFVAATCSGFICFSKECKLRELYLCNPLTQECVKFPELPKPPLPEGLTPNYVVFGLGIDLTCKRQSKLVRMFCNYLKGNWVIECDVYTFESNSWRSIGVSKFRPLFHAVLHNWTLYWIVIAKPSSTALVLTFDLETEKFRFVSPPNTNVGHSPVLPHVTKLGEELCYVQKYEGETTIHVLEDDATTVWSVRSRFTSDIWTSSVSEYRISLCGVWANGTLLVKNYHHIYSCDIDGMKVEEILVPGGWIQETHCNHLVGQFFPNLMSPKLFFSSRMFFDRAIIKMLDSYLLWLRCYSETYVLTWLLYLTVYVELFLT